MKRVVVVLAVVAAVATGVTAVVVWRIAHRGAGYPQISAFSHGQLARVGPYRFCKVLDLHDCADGGTQGELSVTDRDPVQLSVPSAIGEAPWRLLRVYDKPEDTMVTIFRPDTRLAVTIPTVDAQRGRLRGIAVQLMTLVRNEAGEVFDVPHAEWSVSTVWP